MRSDRPSRIARGSSPLALLTVAALLAGCAANSPTPTIDQPGTVAGPLLSLPKLVGSGFEPGLALGRNGELAVTAHKSGTIEDGRLSSWVWASRDAGVTWNLLQSPDGRDAYLPGIEGDVTFGRDGLLYFVDTWGHDAFVDVWDLNATVLKSSRPIASAEYDDRPWIRALDAQTMLLMTQTDGSPAGSVLGAVIPDKFDAGRGRIFESTDHGATWTLTAALPRTRYCGLATDPGRGAAFASCEIQTADPQKFEWGVFARRSGAPGWDRAWTLETPVVPGWGFPEVSAGGGVVLASMADEDLTDEKPGVVWLASLHDGSWKEQRVDVAGSIGPVWVTLGLQGHGVVAYERASNVKPTKSTEWRLVGRTFEPATGALGEERALSANVTARGESPPRDFFEVQLDSADVLHVVWHEGEGFAGLTNARVLYARVNYADLARVT